MKKTLIALCSTFVVMIAAQAMADCSTKYAAYGSSHTFFAFFGHSSDPSWGAYYGTCPASHTQRNFAVVNGLFQSTNGNTKAGGMNVFAKEMKDKGVLDSAWFGFANDTNKSPTTGRGAACYALFDAHYDNNNSGVSFSGSSTQDCVNFCGGLTYNGARGNIFTCEDACAVGLGFRAPAATGMPCPGRSCANMNYADCTGDGSKK